MKTRNITVKAIPFVLVCFIFLPNAQAISPPPDGGYPGGNTAEGQSALFTLTTGGFNTAIGYFSLRSNTTNSFNTAVGAGSLLANIGDENTATGTGALLSNTTGPSNTANGAFALSHNTTGANNTAVGTNALVGNTDGNDNTAIGTGALFQVPEGNRNVAVGQNTLLNRPGDDNVALGTNAGTAQNPPSTSHSDSNIYIGSNVHGVADESHACYIGNIWQSDAFDGPMPVLVTMDNKLGTNTSSRRFKRGIEPIGKASEALFALKPVTFRYRKDPAGTVQFGLVAEDVEIVNPELVVHDKEGKPYSVRYDQVNAMLLNEFLKEHKAFIEEQCKVREQGVAITQQRKELEAAIAQQQKQVDALTAAVKEQALQIENVTAHLKLSKGTVQTIAGN